MNLNFALAVVVHVFQHNIYVTKCAQEFAVLHVRFGITAPLEWSRHNIQVITVTVGKKMGNSWREIPGAPTRSPTFDQTYNTNCNHKFC